MAQRNTPGNNTPDIADDSSSSVIPSRAPLPDTLQGIISLDAWAESLVNGKAYDEPYPDYLSKMLLLQTITAESVADVYRQGGLAKLQEAVPNIPGGTTGPIEITDLYVTGSDFGEGVPCYVIVTATSMDTGEQRKYTTGASQVQAQLLRLLSLGVWPIKCQIRRLDRKDRGGRYLFWLFPPD